MTDHPNLVSARRIYEALATGDIPTALEMFSPDVEFHIGANFPLTGTYLGIAECLGFFAKVMQISGGTFQTEVHDILANDTHVVAMVRVTAQREGHEPLDANVVHVWHVDENCKFCEYWPVYIDDATINEFWS
jgi:ketosteroid isomerase-like protein